VSEEECQALLEWIASFETYSEPNQNHWKKYLNPDRTPTLGAIGMKAFRNDQIDVAILSTLLCAEEVYRHGGAEMNVDAILRPCSQEEAARLLQDVLPCCASNSEVLERFTEQYKSLPEIHRVGFLIANPPGSFYDTIGSEVTLGGWGPYCRSLMRKNISGWHPQLYYSVLLML